MKERNLHVCPVFNIKMSSHITVYATPGPQTTRHPVIPYSCAVRSDLGRCSIHHSPPFGHTIKVWAAGWCNKLLSNRSTLESSGKANVPCLPPSLFYSKHLLSIFCVQPTTTSLCMSSVYAPFNCFIQHKPKVHYTAPHHCIHSINIWNHSKQSNPRRHRDHFTDTMYSHHLWILLAD